ncbi:MAG: ATP-binding protein [Candidatus Omnitrophota bacterium]
MEEPKMLINNIKTDINDIIEREKAEKRFRQYQFMVASEHGAIFFKNLNSQYVVVNNKALETLGLSGQQVIGKDDAEILLDRKKAAEIIKDDQLVFDTGKPREFTKHITDKEGEKHWLHTIKFLWFDDKGNIIGLVGIIRDITERKRIEKEHIKIAEAERRKAEELEKVYKELQDSEEELIRSEKLAYTGRIAASVAHEVRNPLANVSMSIQQLRKAIANKDSRAKKHIEIVERNIQRINYLITELLNCARPPKLNMCLSDIHKVLKNVLSTVWIKIESRKIEIVKHFYSKPSKIMIDKEQMGRVFLNLVLNAIEAMPKGGKLTILTEIKENFFVTRIEDTGKGIPEKDIIKMFDPFFSTKNEGVGLGLTLCYGVVVSHEGTIEVESKWRKGSTFTVSLPVRQKLRESRLK